MGLRFRGGRANWRGAEAATPVPAPSTYGPSSPWDLRTVSVGATEIVVQWDAGADDATHDPATSYEVQRAIEGSLSSFTNGTGATSGATTALQWTFGGLTPNTAYDFRVKATNSVGSTLFIHLGSVITEPAAGAVRIRWPQRRDETGTPITTDTFAIYGSQTQGGPHTLLASVSNAALATLPAQTGEVIYYRDITGLASGDWYFTLATIDPSGNESDPSPEEKRTLP